MNHTKIEWVRNPDGTQGYTWNPMTGCLNHINGLCKGGGFPCYAYKLANGRLKSRYLANTNWAKHASHPEYDSALNAKYDPFYPRFWEERLDDIKSSDAWWDTLGGRQAKGIFTCDMGELFGDWVPEAWQKEIFDAIKSDPLDRFYLLTKQPQNLAKFSPFPNNCWVGVTATNFKMYGEALFYLGEVEAKVKYLSFEPLLSRLDPAPYGPYTSSMMSEDLCAINWLIIGAQTKPYKPPRLEWVKEIVRAADQAGIPVFLKNNLKFSKEFENDQVLRQEVPR